MLAALLRLLLVLPHALLGVYGLQAGQWSRLTPHRRAAVPLLSVFDDPIATEMREIAQKVPCLQSALDAAISASELAYVGQLHAEFTRHTGYLTAGSDDAAATLRQVRVRVRVRVTARKATATPWLGLGLGRRVAGS